MGLFNFLFNTDQIEQALHSIERKLEEMSEQEQALNEALQAFFAAISAGLDRIEAKLAEQAPNVDLSDEVAAIKEAQASFEARVAADTEAPEPPAEPEA